MNDLSRTLRREVARLQEENRELREEVLSLRQYVNSVNALMDAVQDLDYDAPIMPLLDRILFNAMIVTRSRNSSLLVVDDETAELVFILVKGEGGQEHLIGNRLPPGKGIVGWVVDHQQPTIVNNAYSDGRFYSSYDEASTFQTDSILAVPIIGRDKVLGVIEVLNKRDGMPFNDADQTLLLLLCRFAGEVLFTMVNKEDVTPV